MAFRRQKDIIRGCFGFCTIDEVHIVADFQYTGLPEQQGPAVKCSSICSDSIRQNGMEMDPGEGGPAMYEIKKG